MDSNERINMQKISFKDGVSETLLINLYFRSLENKLPKPLLKDEFSGAVVDKIDYDFSKFDSSDMSRIGVIIRAKYFDDEIIEFAKNKECIVVVQVGAGFDTRPLRLEHACPNAVFYDLDLPDVIKFRDELVPKAKQNFSLACSMLETAWMDELAGKYPQTPFIFVLEGVSMYFEESEMKGFFLNLAKRFKGEVALDLLNVWCCKMMAKNHTKHDTLKYIKDAKTKFGIDDPRDIERWDDEGCIKYLKTGIMMDMYLNRWPFKARLMRFIPTLKHSCTMSVYGLNLAQ